MPDNLYELLKGLSPQQASDVLDDLQVLLDNIKPGDNTMSAEGLIALLRGTAGTREYRENNRPAPGPYDLQAAERKYQSLSDEMERLALSKNPAQHQPRMEQIAKDLRQLEAEYEQNQQNIRAANLAQFQGERQQLEADIDDMAIRREGLYKNYTNHQSEIGHLNTQIEQRQARLNEINSGEPAPQWTGAENVSNQQQQS
jgi:chromosome segregation ATPase